MKKEDIGHPNVDWLDSRNKTTTQRDIRFVDILSEAQKEDKRVNKVLDRMRCFVWELYRTKYFTEKLFRDFIDKQRDEAQKIGKLDYPMSIDSWPVMPYLVNPVAERIFWKMENMYWGMFEHPMLPYDQDNPTEISLSEDEKFTNKFQEPAKIFDDSKCKINDVIHFFDFPHEEVITERSDAMFSLKYPVTFYLEPNITKVALKRGIEKYWKNLVLLQRYRSPVNREGLKISII